MGKVIGIVSLKGGVGKTSTVSGLGTALSNLGKKVLLIDANFSAPNLGIHFNIANPKITIQEVLAKNLDIRDSIYVLEDLFHIIPASLFGEKNFNPLELGNKVKEIKNDYDMVVIDSSPTLNNETLAAMISSDEIFAVTTPDYPTLATTIKAVREAKSKGVPVNGIILNRVYGKEFELTLDEIEDASEIPVMAIIPHDVNIMKAQANFVPSVMQNPKSKASVEYKKLAATLVGEKPKGFRISKLFGSGPKKHEINRELYYKSVFG